MASTRRHSSISGSSWMYPPLITTLFTPARAAGFGGIEHVFGEHHRLAIGVGDGGASILAREPGQIRRRKERARYLLRPRPARCPSSGTSCN